MRFDNEQFEKNVGITMKSLEQLKQSLSFDNVKDGFKDISNAAKNVTLDGLGKGIDTVQVKFSALQVAGITAIQNIVNSAINAGKHLVSSLTIDPVKQGFTEYETKMGSIQTIMASTGESLETVNRYLGELNEYSDKTIYSFSDMTSSIGKFTNAGVNLDDAVKAIKGISNEAAVSGANANEASRAMYNFAQALSSGYVKLIDWKSIENANMATMEFKQQLIDTAVSLGTVVKQGEEYVTVTTDANGKVSDLFTSTKNFNDSLSNQWMTTEVLVETLGKYADETTNIGKKAYAAAQDVKTFSQLTETLQEAVGSGWATTFEILFGNLEEAKQLWTGVSEVVGGFIDRTSDARNNMLQSWKNLAGRQDIIDSFKNIGSLVSGIGNAIKSAFSEVFPRATTKNAGLFLKRITYGIKNLTAVLRPSETFLNNVKNAFSGLFSVVSIFAKVINIVISAFVSFVKAISPAGNLLSKFGSLLMSGIGIIGQLLTLLNEAIDRSHIFEKAAEGIYNGILFVANSIRNFVLKIYEFFKSIKDLKFEPPDLSLYKTAFLDKLGSITTKIQNGLSALIGHFSKFSELKFKVPNVVLPFNNIYTKISEYINRIITKFSELTGLEIKVPNLMPFYTSVKDRLTIIVGFVGEKLSTLRERISETVSEVTAKGGTVVDVASSLVEQARGHLSKFAEKIEEGFTNLPETLTTIQNTVSSFGEKVKAVFGAAFDWIANGITAFINKLPAIGLGIKNGFSSFFNGIKNGFESAKLAISNGASSISTVLDSFKAGFADAGENIQEVFSKIGNGIKAVWDFLNSLGLLNVTRILEGITFIFLGKNMTKSIKSFTELLGLMKTSIPEAMSAITGGITEAIKNPAGLKTFFEQFGGIGGGASELLTSVKDTLKAYQNDLKADVLIKVAGAIAILAGSIMLLSMIDSDKLIVASGAVAVLLGELVTAMTIFGKSAKGSSKDIKSGVSNFIDSAAINSLTTNVIKFSVAILALSKALTVISNIDPNRLWESMAAMSVMMTELVMILKICADMPAQNKLPGIGFGLIELGAALLIISQAVKVIGNMRPEMVIQGLAGVTAALFGISAAVQYMPSGKDMMGTGLGLMEIGAALLILSLSIKAIGNMEGETLAKGLIGIAGSLLGIGAAMRLMPSGKDMIGTGLGLIEISVALAIIAAVMKSVAGNSWEDIAKGLTLFAGSMIALGAATALMPSGVTMVLIGAGLAVIAVSFAILVKTMEAASKLSWSAIGKGMLVFGAALAAIAAAGIILSVAVLPIAGVFKVVSDFGMSIGMICKGLAELTATLILLGAAGAAGAAGLLAALAVLLPGISMLIITNTPLLVMAFEVLLRGLLAMLVSLVVDIAEAIMELIRGVLQVLVDYTPEIGNLLFDFMCVLMDVAIARMPDLVEKMPAFVKALKELLGSIVGDLNPLEFLELMTAFTMLLILTHDIAGLKIGMIGKALLGVVQMGAVLAALTGVLVGLGALTKIPGLQDFVDHGAELLLSVGRAIGDFVGALIGGLVEGIMAPLPEIATSLSQFMENIQGFVEGAAAIDKSSFDGIPALVGAIMAITAAEIVDAVGNFVSFLLGQNGMDTFGQDLVMFGSYLKAYANEISGIDSKAVEASAKAGQMLAEMANMVPNSGGLVSLFTGDNNVSKFGEDLVEFGAYMKVYAQLVSGINSEAVTSSASVGQMLADMASTIPNTGGLVSLFTGDNSISKFGEELSRFGPYIKQYGEDVSELNTEAVDASASAARILADIARIIPNNGGLGSWFTGDNKLSDFGKELSEFGPYIKQYGVAVSTLNSEAVTASSAAIQMLSDMASKLPNNGGVVSWFTGDNKLSDFGKELADFGPLIKRYGVSITGIDASAIEASASAAQMLSDMASNLPNSGGLVSWFTGDNKLSDFAEELEDFGPAIKRYGVSIIGLDTAAVDASVSSAKMLSGLYDNLPATDGLKQRIFGEKSLSDFGEQLAEFGPYMKKYSVSIVGIDEKAVGKSIGVAEMLMALADNLPETGGKIAEWFGGKMNFETFGKSLESFGMSFVGFSASVSTVDVSNLPTVMTEFSRLIDFGTGLATIDTSVYGEFAKGLKSLGESGLSEFINAFSNCTEDVNSAVATLFSAIASTLTSKMPTDLAPSIENTCKDILEEFKDQIKEDTYKDFAYERIIKSIISGIYDRKEYALNAVKGLCEDIIDKAEEIIKEDTFKSMASTNIVDALKNGINSYVSQTFLFAAINNLTKSIESLFRSGLDLYSVGQYATIALAQGIWSKSIDVTNAISGICQGAIDAAKKKLDEHSPSKVFDEIGMFIPMAMVNGILRLKDDVGDATSALGDTAINSMTNSISSIVDAINSDLNADPVIRPVLDLSEIQNGVGTINGMFSNGIPIGTSINAVGDISGRMSANLYNSGIEEVGGKPETSTYYNFTQNNYSPKALSRKEIYRQTRNQFAAMRG